MDTCGVQESEKLADLYTCCLFTFEIVVLKMVCTLYQQKPGGMLINILLLNCFINGQLPINSIVSVTSVWVCLSGVETGSTLLHFSARLGLAKFTSYLLNLPGAKEAVNMDNKWGMSPVDIASENSNNDTAKLLNE